tara:strand:+ start:4279 stop:5070 length:792 start_codon:yes stop_codon:yes gene_type:complete
MEIRITLETLYDILRNEKKRAELQKLEETFFEDLVVYMKQKKQMLDNADSSDNMFASGEREKLEYELRSIRRIIKEVYEKREKKLIDIALNKSRTQSDLIDTSSMLPEEKEFFYSLTNHLDVHRKGVLLHLMQGNLPSLSVVNRDEKTDSGSSLDDSHSIDTKELENNETASELTAESELSESVEESHTEVEQNAGTEVEESSSEEVDSSEVDFKKIEFTQPVADFIWTDMKEYGPFEPGDQTSIWPEVADLLIKKGHAVEVD